MKRRLLIAATLQFFGATAWGQTRAIGPELDAYLRPFIANNNFSGTIGVWRHGKALYERSGGLASPAFGIANAPGTKFRIASISKAFTAALVLLFEERGLLGTSDPVAKFLPDYANGSRIRLENLLLHNSGIPEVPPPPAAGEDHPWSTTELVALFQDRPLSFEPGSRFAYTNSDYALLARILEIVGKARYDVLIDSLIVKPLRLKATGDGGDARRVVSNLAIGTEPEGLSGVRYVPYQQWSLGTGSGSLYSTASDLCAFAQAVFDGSLLSEVSRAKLGAAKGIFPYGWTNRERGGRRVKASGGRLRGFIVNLEYFTDDGTCVAILTNSYSSVGQMIAEDLGRIVAGERVQPPAVAHAKPKLGQLAAFVGTFQLPSNYYVPSAKLTLRDHGDYLEGEWSAGGESVIYPTGGDDFIDRTNWAMVHFERDADGRVVGFTYKLLQDFAARRLD